MPTPYKRLKRVLFGRPLASDRLEHERLNKKTALAVLSSDAISSVAYATEQTLLVLAVLGTAALSYVVPISAVIVGLLVLVALSYRQTMFAYPGGGGSYTVAKDNLGPMPGLDRGRRVAHRLHPHRLSVDLERHRGDHVGVSDARCRTRCSVHRGDRACSMLVNLRGVRESGIAFSVPTYVFIAMMLALIGARAVPRLWARRPLLRADARRPASAAHQNSGLVGFALTFLILRGFAEGCVAMTGTEAISNGVGAFGAELEKRCDDARMDGGDPRRLLPRHERLARHYGVMPSATETVLSQLGRHIFGGGSAILRTAVLDVRHPRSRGQHRVRRLSAPVEHPGPRWLHAAAIRRARRPAGVLQRHHRARARRRAARSGCSAATRARSFRSTRSACSSASRCRRRAW